MLSYEDVKNIGDFKKLEIKNAERDYLQEVVLFVLYDKIVNKELVFKGGTCLYKVYKLNRFSEDLDFTLNGKLDLEKLVTKLYYNLSSLGVNSRIKEIKKYKNEINIRLLLHGPLYKGRTEEECFIPINISRRERVSLEPKYEMIISMYRDLSNFTVFIMDEKEILAEKIRAIYSRDVPRDVYDLWFLLIHRHVAINENFLNKKLKLIRIKFNFNEFMTKVETKRKLWERDLKNLIMGQLPDFGAVKNDISKAISKI